MQGMLEMWLGMLEMLAGDLAGVAGDADAGFLTVQPICRAIQELSC